MRSLIQLISRKISRKFNFKAFLRLLLIIISIEVQLIDWCYNNRQRSRKLKYVNIEGLISMFENLFLEKWSFSELNNFLQKTASIYVFLIFLFSRLNFPMLSQYELICKYINSKMIIFSLTTKDIKPSFNMLDAHKMMKI